MSTYTREKRDITPAGDIPQPSMKPSKGDPVSDIKVEPPFTDYTKVHPTPYTVEYFQLGKYWDTDDVYTKEVLTIENHLREHIEQGDLDNSLAAVKLYFKRLQKTADIDKTDPTVVKVGKLAAFTKFLSEVKDIKKNKQHYGAS